MFVKLGKIILRIYRFALAIKYPIEYKKLKLHYKEELALLYSYCGEKFNQKKLYDSHLVQKKWNKIIESNFEAQNSEQWYLSWKDEFGLIAVAANIHDQFRRFELYLKMKKLIKPNQKILDIGCGSASLYWSLLKSNKITLVDLPNENQKYVKFKCAQSTLKNQKDLEDLNTVEEKFDVIFLIDVLEHLKNPSHFFKHKVHEHLKNEGLLFLQAPWGGISEHLPEAPVDWAEHGEQFLKDNYVKICSINHIFSATNYYLSSVYKKR